MKTHIAITGACGRMGKRLVALANEDHSLQVVAAIASPTNRLQGQDVGEIAGIGKLGVPITYELPLSIRPDCVIDFSTPEGTMSILPVCVARQIPIVVATTGHTSAQKAEIEAAGHQTAVLFAPSMSLVVNLLFKLVRLTATALNGKGFDAENNCGTSPSLQEGLSKRYSRAFAHIIQEVQGGHFVHGRDT